MCIEFTLGQALALVECFGGDDATTVTVVSGDAHAHSGPGLYAYPSEYPDEGAHFLGAGDVGSPNALPPDPVARTGQLRRLGNDDYTRAGDLVDDEAGGLCRYTGVTSYPVSEFGYPLYRYDVLPDLLLGLATGKVMLVKTPKPGDSA